MLKVRLKVYRYISFKMLILLFLVIKLLLYWSKMKNVVINKKIINFNSLMLKLSFIKYNGLLLLLFLMLFMLILLMILL